MPKFFLATSKAIAKTPHLSELLGHPLLHYRSVKDFTACAGVLAWGLKPSAVKAAAFASRHNLPLLRLEDGFLRSVGLGKDEPPLSIVRDDLGIYYDATAPSRLEALVGATMNPGQSARTQSLIAAWREARVSKYNHARDFEGNLPKPYVLLADQVAGDVSIKCGLAGAETFQRMLAAALQDNPACTILVKIHPDVLRGKNQGHFDLAKLALEARVQVLAENVHPVTLIENAEAVYCVTSQIGFEGLLWGKRVHTFGMPFYAGWGLTCDALTAPERRQIATLEALVHAALIAYPSYLDPETQQICEPERLLAWLGLQRRMRGRFPAIVHAVGFSDYKKPIVRRFCQGSEVVFTRELTDNATQIVWGRRCELAANLIRLEDGFIRSVGLGADLVHPLSWAMDTRGIYYDASQPSDLENILQNLAIDDALAERAQHLHERLIAHAITKYNIGAAQWQRPHNQALILVPGQVESDASLAFGAPGIRQNIELLIAVRNSNPDAYIVYKPHPDVVAGLRQKGRGENQASRYCDEIVIDVPMGQLLTQVDEVHTLTSLTGFEALLRGKKVVCYGQPFYAGWGLTEDVLPLARRTRKLTLTELVAGVLILYPTYISRSTGKFTTPERVLQELLEWRDHEASLPKWWRVLCRRLLRAEIWFAALSQLGKR